MTTLADQPVQAKANHPSMRGESFPDPNVEGRLVDPLAGAQWDELVLSHPNANFFHSAAWAKVLAKSYDHTPLYLHFSRRGELLALVPMMEVNSYITGRRGVCLPFSDFCSPLLFNGCKAEVVTAKLSAMAMERNWKHFQIRGGNLPELANDPAVEYFGHSLDLRQGAAGLFAGFSSPVRRAIRKGEESKVRIEISHSLESVMEFYRLHVQTRRRHGLPPQPFSFFHHIFAEVIQKGAGFVVRARLESRIVAAAIFFQFGRTAIYKFGASEPAAQPIRANNLVMWQAIRFLADSGCESLHLGRTSPSDAGLRRFKTGWGTTEERIKYFMWSRATGKWVSGCDHGSGFHNQVFAKMPLSINRLAGAILYPHLD